MKIRKCSVVLESKRKNVTREKCYQKETDQVSTVSTGMKINHWT